MKMDDAPTKKKEPIVSKAELDKSGYKTLRDFMNAKQYDEATGKFVDRKGAPVKNSARIRDEELDMELPDKPKKEKKPKMANKFDKPPVSPRGVGGRFKFAPVPYHPFTDVSHGDVTSTTPLVSYLLASPAERLEMKRRAAEDREEYKKGGSVKSSASKRGDGCATKGKTRGKMV
jgi:hypothetical protein